MPLNSAANVFGPTLNLPIQGSRQRMIENHELSYLKACLSTNLPLWCLLVPIFFFFFPSSTGAVLNKHLLSWKLLHPVLSMEITPGEWIAQSHDKAASARRSRSRVESKLDPTVYHSVVWALTKTYGVVYFYNVIIPPPATTPLKLCACWGKNLVKSPADLDTAEHKQWSEGLCNTRRAHGQAAAHISTPCNFCCCPKRCFGSYKTVQSNPGVVWQCLSDFNKISSSLQ